MKLRLLSSLLLLCIVSANAFAHEYWLQPETFYPAVGSPTAVRLYVADGLVKDREEMPYLADKTVTFRLYSAGSMLDLKPGLIEKAMPVYTFNAAKPGQYLLAMERNWSYIKLDAAKFEEYLREDGMDHIIAERAKLGESAKEGRERYSRFIKSLLKVGAKNDATWKKRLGLKLEITPLEDPTLKTPGSTIQFQIHMDGKPLANRVVFADNAESETQRMTTDKSGKFTFKIGKSGHWLVRLVTMQRCTKDCGESDWESFWSAFSFGVK